EDSWVHNVGDNYENSNDFSVFSEEGSIYLSSFASFKKEVDGTEYNIILVGNHASFRIWGTATSLAKALNLTNKKDRIALFKSLLTNVEMYVHPSMRVDVSYDRRNEGSLNFTSTQVWEFKEL